MILVLEDPLNIRLDDTILDKFVNDAELEALEKENT